MERKRTRSANYLQERVPSDTFNQTGNLHDKLNHARDEIKKLLSDIFISSMNRCEETINFFRLNLPLFCWGILKHRSVRRVLYERNRAGPGVGQTIENRSVNCRLLCTLGSTCTSHAR